MLYVRNARRRSSLGDNQAPAVVARLALLYSVRLLKYCIWAGVPAISVGQSFIPSLARSIAVVLNVSHGSGLDVHEDGDR